MHIDPVVRNAACQPYLRVTIGIRIGAMSDAALVPELKRPVASARSSVGNHSVVALMAAGKFPDSPRPSMMRATQNPATEKTRAWLMEASAHMPMARA